MKRTYTIKTYLLKKGSKIAQHRLYQGTGTQKELPIRCRGALDERIDSVMRRQARKLERNPDLSPLIETIKIETDI